MLQGTLDISQHSITRYCTQYNFEGKTSVRIQTDERHPYFDLTGELWVFIVSYLEKSDLEISGVLILRHLCSELWNVVLDLVNPPSRENRV